MKTSSAKAKGRRAQQEVRNAILEAFPALEPDDVKCAVMGESGEDVKLSPAARKKFPFSIEVKNVERLNIWQALTQAEANAEKYTPLLAFRRNRTRMYVALPLAAFLELVAERKS